MQCAYDVCPFDVFFGVNLICNEHIDVYPFELINCTCTPRGYASHPDSCTYFDIHGHLDSFQFFCFPNRMRTLETAPTLDETAHSYLFLFNDQKSGINLIDTAPWYGHGKSETTVGKALKSVPRNVSIAFSRLEAQREFFFDPNVFWSTYICRETYLQLNHSLSF